VIELIDRDALMRKHTSSFAHDNKHNTEKELHFLLECIRTAPIINAQPVKHCRWIYNGYDEYPTCSYCNQSDTYAGNYCGNCGARMDADEIAERRAAADDYAEY
jgi:hypothetical protein